MAHPWEQLPEEGFQAYGAFLLYRDMGPDRTIADSYRLYDKDPAAPRPPRFYQLWAINHRWVERAKEYDTHLLTIYDTAAEKEIAKAGVKAGKDWVINAERTLLETSRLSYSRLSDVVHWDAEGHLQFTPSDQLTEHEAAAIKKIKVSEFKGKITKEIELHDKSNPLMLLGQHQKLWGPKQDGNESHTTNNFLVLLQMSKDPQLVEHMRTLLSHIRQDTPEEEEEG